MHCEVKDFESKEVIDLFSKLFDENGYAPKSLVSASWERLEVTYRQIVNNIDQEVLLKDIFDVGCGFCNFYTYLISRFQMPAFYRGVDIVDGFISTASKLLELRLPNSKEYMELSCANFYDLDVDMQFDVVLGLGMSNSLDDLGLFVETMFKWSKDYVIFEGLSSYEYHGVLKSHKPEVALAEVLKHTNNVRLLYDYGDQEFLIIARRNR